MMSRGRLLVLAVSVPVVAFAVIGGFMGKALAREESYQHLRVFEDVVTLILNNYVDDVNVDEVMVGAMRGLADGLDADSAYLRPEDVRAFENGDGAGRADVGLELTRQYYLRVIAARDGSPAAKAGLLPGDYIRAIDEESTRDLSVYDGMRRLRGAPGTTVTLTVLRGNAAEPHEVSLTRAAPGPLAVSSRLAAPDTGYLRVPEFSDRTAAELRSEIAALRKAGAASLVIDLRGTAFGEEPAGLDAARLFVDSGVLGYRQARDQEKVAVSAGAGDGSVSLPVAVLTDNGTSRGAEVFAAALAGRDRATVFGERTLGRAADQKLVRLPDGSGLLLSHLFYLTPDATVLHEKGLVPDVAVEQPDVEFGAAPPATDATLEKAIAHLAARPAA